MSPLSTRNQAMKAIQPDLVLKTFQDLGKGVYTPVELRKVVSSNRDAWIKDSENASTWQVKSRNIADIVDVLTEHGTLSKIQLPFPHRPYQRFTFGDVSALEVLQSVDAKAYFCHFTAIHLHGLTSQIPKTVYLNMEQAASGGRSELTQSGIDRAFKGPCRLSANMIEFRDQRVFKLNGRNTGELGVIEFNPEEARSPLRITNIERTLIDATVRPVYAGGVGQVAEAFAAAADRVSVNKIAAYLHKLRYGYPYHQAIGFYLERTGAYQVAQIELLRQFPMEYDFYLTYEMEEPDYNEKWRLFVPKGFQ